MSLPYEFNHYVLWPATTLAAFSALGAFVWRQRKAPGAVPFLFIIAFAVVWSLANGLLLCATDDAHRLFWYQFQTVFLLPIVTAGLCFGIEYAGLGRLLNLKNLALLTVVPLLYALLVMTNGIHHLAWSEMGYDGYVHFNRGPAVRGAIGYALFASLLNLVVLVWLFIRSPQHRWVAAGLVAALVASRCAALLNVLEWNPFAPVNPISVASKLSMLCYALAFFRFRMFEVVPVARDMVIERMSDAMIVLDIENRIADMNGPARDLFNVSRQNVLGKQIIDVLHAYPDLLSLACSSGKERCEIFFGEDPGRWYHVSTSPLTDRRGFKLGRIIWLHDVTEERAIRLKVLSQQRALASLREREFLARELHDGIGQMLAAVDMQARSASMLLERGDSGNLDACLNSISATTQKGKAFIRDYLLGIKAGADPDQDLLDALSRYISRYHQDFRIDIEVVASPGVTACLDSAATVQLQPIIQEALTNLRKHSGAAFGRVIFDRCDDEIRITVEDEGRGFDPLDIESKGGFGLRSMMGRAEAIGAKLEVNTVAGKGTRLTVRVPCKKERS